MLCMCICDNRTVDPSKNRHLGKGCFLGSLYIMAGKNQDISSSLFSDTALLNLRFEGYRLCYETIYCCCFCTHYILTAVLGFMNDDRTACHIPSDPNAPDTGIENPELSSIYAFNFMSGFLCLTIPVIFFLLLIHGICKEFQIKMFDRPYLRRCLVVLLIIYIAICIVIGVGELALSFYVASIVYPNYKNFMDTLQNGTATAEPLPTVDPDQLLCRPAVYLSAFACLTVLYLLVFILLTVVVGVLITTYVVKTFDIVVNDYITTCLRGVRTTAAGGNGGATRPLGDGNEGDGNVGPTQQLETTV